MSQFKIILYKAVFKFSEEAIGIQIKSFLWFFNVVYIWVLLLEIGITSMNSISSCSGPSGKDFLNKRL